MTNCEPLLDEFIGSIESTLRTAEELESELQKAHEDTARRTDLGAGLDRLAELNAA